MKRPIEVAYTAGILQLVSGRVRIELEVHLTAKSRLFSPCTFASQLLPVWSYFPPRGCTPSYHHTFVNAVPLLGMSSFLPLSLWIPTSPSGLTPWLAPTSGMLRNDEIWSPEFNLAELAVWRAIISSNAFYFIRFNWLLRPDWPTVQLHKCLSLAL